MINKEITGTVVVIVVRDLCNHFI